LGVILRRIDGETTQASSFLRRYAVKTTQTSALFASVRGQDDASQKAESRKQKSGKPLTRIDLN